MAGLMDRLKGLFSGGGETAPAAAAEPTPYKDFLIHVEPLSEGGQWRLGGRIVHGEGEARREHRFIRADIFTNRDEVDAATIRKAQRLIDEQGTKLFEG